MSTYLQVRRPAYVPRPTTQIDARELAALVDATRKRPTRETVRMLAVVPPEARR